MRRQLDACVAGGVHGIAILGIVTEFNKLDVNERRQIIEWTAEDLAGRVPLAVTINELSVHGQIEMCQPGGRGRRRLGHPSTATGQERPGVRTGGLPGQGGRGGKLAGRDPEQPDEPRCLAFQQCIEDPQSQSSQRQPAQGRGPDRVCAPDDGGNRRRLSRFQRARRVGVAGQPAARVCRPHPRAGLRRRDGPCLRPDDRQRPRERRAGRAPACRPAAAADVCHGLAGAHAVLRKAIVRAAGSGWPRCIRAIPAYCRRNSAST